MVHFGVIGQDDILFRNLHFITGDGGMHNDEGWLLEDSARETIRPKILDDSAPKRFGMNIVEM